MKAKIGYWLATGLFSLMMAGSGGAYLAGSPQMVEAFHHLGYPDYFRVTLGVAKVLGVLALLAPRVPRTVREWAYAGFAIVVVMAAISHAASGDPAGKVAMPLVALAILVASRALLSVREKPGAAEGVAKSLASA